VTIVACNRRACSYNRKAKTEEEDQIGEYICSKDYIILFDKKCDDEE